MLTVNRTLPDEDMDRIDHALGRPLDPMGETYRAYFATTKNGAIASAMKVSRHWQEESESSELVFFSVTKSGRRALAKYLRQIGDKHRAFAITYDGGTVVVAAETAGEARYRAYGGISDCCPDLTFGEFLRASRVLSS